MTFAAVYMCYSVKAAKKILMMKKLEASKALIIYLHLREFTIIRFSGREAINVFLRDIMF